METVTFDKLLLKTAFCCMASDGHIDNREIALIENMCKNSLLFKDFNFHEEINLLVSKMNLSGKDFISNFFNLLIHSDLTIQEELILIDFAIRTIKADEQIEYSEIKLFKNIRNRLKISNENILEVYPDIEQFLEDDIITESYIDKTTKQFLENIELPQFKLLNINPGEMD